jgi:hypothetical protein
MGTEREMAPDYNCYLYACLFDADLDCQKHFFPNIRSGVFKISSGDSYTRIQVCKKKQINIQKTK